MPKQKKNPHKIQLSERQHPKRDGFATDEWGPESWRGDKGQPRHKNLPQETAVCPECDNDVRFGKATHPGQQVTCTHCGTRLQVIGQEPLELDWAFEAPVKRR